MAIQVRDAAADSSSRALDCEALFHTVITFASASRCKAGNSRSVAFPSFGGYLTGPDGIRTQVCLLDSHNSVETTFSRAPVGPTTVDFLASCDSCSQRTFDVVLDRRILSVG